MGKNDFDIDFDFEKEYGFDPKSFLGDEEYDDNIDLSEFSDEELGLTSHTEPEPEEDTAAPVDDLDLSGLDLDSDYDLDVDLDLDDFLNMGEEKEEAQEEESPEDFPPEEEFEEELYEPEETSAEFPETEEFDDEPVFEQPEETEMNRNTEYPEEMEQEVFEDGPVYNEEPAEPKPPRQRQRKEPKERKKVNLPKLTTPNVFTRFFDLYFGPLLDKSKREEPVDPNNPRRRRRKSKAQIFKEVYLPPITVCVCLVLVLSFAIGSLSNAIAQHQIDKDAEASRLASSEDAAALQEQEYQRVLAEAEVLAQGYDYEGAQKVLEAFGDLSQYPELSAKHAEYVTAEGQLVEYHDPSSIPNLSFHVLIHDLSRALKDTDYGGSYNKNFISTSEFSQILNGLYNNGYVLVDFDSFIETNKDVNGEDMFYATSIWLPANKKPVMITETMVNYFNYMIDSDDDKVADAGGDGFANKLVLQNGEIKAEYVDASGQTLVGNYDLVPILEDFIKEHPDFCYRGARAILAVTGHEGVFGYRLNTSYIASKGQDYYDQQKAGAIEIVNALKEKGYTIACYTYANVAYGSYSATQITSDLENWTKQIEEVIGEVDTFVFAKNSSITDYTGGAFQVMYTNGFRYFISQGTQPWAEVKTSYVRQNRLMVTGENMMWYRDQFNGMFDCAAILDVNTRGDVPKS